MDQQTTLTSRPASRDGEILVVTTLQSGAKVLVDFADRDDIVELQLYRRVRLVDLAYNIRLEFGVPKDANAVYIPLPAAGICGFSFDGSALRAVCLQNLPDGQIVYALPDVAQALARVRVIFPSPVLAGRAAVKVAA